MKNIIATALFTVIASLSGWANAQSKTAPANSSASASAPAADPYASAGVYDRCVAVSTPEQSILVTAGKDDKGRWYTCGKNSAMTISNLPSFYATSMAQFYCDKSKPISSVPVSEDGYLTIYCTYNNFTENTKINANLVKVVH